MLPFFLLRDSNIRLDAEGDMDVVVIDGFNEGVRAVLLGVSDNVVVRVGIGMDVVF